MRVLDTELQILAVSLTARHQQLPTEIRIGRLFGSNHIGHINVVDPLALEQALDAGIGKERIRQRREADRRTGCVHFGI